jgi:hypothetical protein
MYILKIKYMKDFGLWFVSEVRPSKEDIEFKIICCIHEPNEVGIF